jgi:GDPmannose 4,6-dehydratase
VREFVEKSFGHVGVQIVWEGEGIHEVGKDAKDGRVLVKVNPAYFRPTEVELLWGNPAKIKATLKWELKVKFDVRQRIERICVKRVRGGGVANSYSR